jgi:hypothetical protein
MVAADARPVCLGAGQHKHVPLAIPDALGRREPPNVNGGKRRIPRHGDGGGEAAIPGPPRALDEQGGFPEAPKCLPALRLLVTHA